MGNILLFEKREEQKQKQVIFPDDFDPLFPGEENVDGEIVTFIGNC